MKVVLRADVEKLGKEGDLITVKDGYARNFLIPKGMALEAHPRNLKVIEELKKSKLIKIEKERKEIEKFAEQLSKTSCTISVKAGVDDKLFGVVTSGDIAQALETEGIKIDKRKICLEEPINKLGVYLVPVKISPEISSNLKVWVIKQ